MRQPFRHAFLLQGLACSLLLTGCDFLLGDLPAPGSTPRPSASPATSQSPSPVTTPSGQSPSATASPMATVSPAATASPAATQSPAGPCGAAELKTAALPAGLSLPAGLQARIFDLPDDLKGFGSVFFDAQGQAYVFSSENGKKQIFRTDPCGRLEPAYSNDILLGRGGKFAVPEAGGNLVVGVDYWPDGGTLSSGLYDLSRTGQAAAIKTPKEHGGLGGVIAAPRGERFLAAEPGTVKAPAGTQVRMLKSTYAFGPLGHGFYDANGRFYVFSSSAHRKQIARIDQRGNSSIVADHELLRYGNWRSGASSGNGVLAAIDYAPAAGGPATGLHLFGADGQVSEWKTAQGHSGLFDVIPAPQGGYYFSDFENDNVWYKADAATPEVAVIDAAHSVVPAALASLAHDGDTLYALNRKNTEWWGSGAGEKGVYAIKGGIATLLAKAADDSQFSGLALGQGGIFAKALYTIDEKSQSVVRVNADGSLTPVVTGLVQPYGLKIDPLTGTMAILCDNRFIVFVGAQVPAYSPDPLAGKGWIYSDFETDNLWYLTGRGGDEAGLIETGIPPGLHQPVWHEGESELYALNAKGTGWPFGGDESVYRVQANGKAVQVFKAPAEESFGGLIMGDGRNFSKDLLLTLSSAGQVASLRDGQLMPLISGLPKPGYLRLDPVSGNLLVVANGGKSLAWIGQNLGGTTVPPVGDKGGKLFDNGNIAAVYNGAPCPPGFSLDRPTRITEIMNYHWNDARGAAPPGSIGLKAADGTVLGPWEITTAPGQGGVPNAYWYARPNQVVPAGRYTITDSQPGSWSYNSQSGCSISWVYGIPQ